MPSPHLPSSCPTSPIIYALLKIININQLICWYHLKYGGSARKCRKPCEWLNLSAPCSSDKCWWPWSYVIAFSTSLTVILTCNLILVPMSVSFPLPYMNTNTHILCVSKLSTAPHSAYVCVYNICTHLLDWFKFLRSLFKQLIKHIPLHYNIVIIPAHTLYCDHSLVFFNGALQMIQTSLTPRHTYIMR